MLTINNTLDGFLKDVEIKGNTIQDAENLADIRSVGDKVEGQELYKIPVLSVGKNLIPSNLIAKGWINSDGVLGNGDSTVIKFVKVKQLTNYSFSNNGKWFNIPTIFYYDKDKKLISKDTYIWKLSTPSNCCYVQLYLGDGIYNNVQLEEGTQATPYEPYQEDKLTILSPVQLEKVGDVADRIICKDGVWGVEKNNDEIRLDEQVFGVDDIPSVLGEYVTLPVVYHKCSLGNSLIEQGYCITTFGTRLTAKEWSNPTKEGIYIGKNAFGIVLKIETIGGNTKTHMKNYFLNKNHKFKRSVATPQFIPLPHDQQIKLRTFAGQTNIHFETEIEGTIKAQVPKSIGATVNSHTEQIGNLSKELDRVKKLEESTVSTVTTESDFTAVEETSNGYFEDVKLEGRTLVNLNGTSLITITDNILRTSIPLKLKPNTTYTIVTDCANKKAGTLWTIQRADGTLSVTGGYKEDNVYKFTTGQYEDYCLYFYNQNSPIKDDKDLLKNNIILEGDHTQNPPEYFEGLMSVGQDVDEVSVESVNENLFDGEFVVGSITDATGVDNNSTSAYRSKNYIKVDSNEIYYYGFDINQTFTSPNVYCYDENKNFISKISSVSNLTKFTTPTNCKYVRVRIFDISNFKDVSVTNAFISKKDYYTPHQSNKKPLLYYNPTTETWGKPILRQWDSIEKHSDGKYYYHKRSGEVVLNGSENWIIDNNNTRFGLYNIDSITGNVNVNVEQVSDKFSVYDRYGEKIGSFGVGTGFVRIQNNFGFTTANEFKQWLQANPTTVVYQLAEEKAYECTNIDLITYENETSYIVNSGAIAPKSTLKVHSNISNVVKILQEKVSLLESNVKASQEVQDMMILESDMRILDIELALMEHMPIKLNLGENIMPRSATYFNFIKGHIVNETYSKDYLENVMNKYLATNRLTQEEYDELYKILYPQNYDIELPIEE